ncbi:MAG: glycosyltransferase family 2 protein [Candidatus Daviesbacteria bacterium]|nr:glycosyltransferase family 2 protein [Candidatus Daviesbacteria bacterium]
MKLSAVVITKNEEDRIKACLESVKWADEIVVVDNGSTDKTLQIVEKYTEKILKTDVQDFAAIRNIGVEKATGEWILFVDADERVLMPLKTEIEAMINFTDFSALAISRKNIIFGKEAKYGPFWPDWVIRLLKKTDFDGWVGKVHEQPKFRGNLGYSKNPLLHLTHRSLDQIVLKSLEWSKIDANLRLDVDHPKMSGWRFLRIFITEVFNQGIIRRGFFNGTVGVMDSLLQAFSFFMTYVRLWEMQQSNPRNKFYDELDKKLIECSFKDS